MQLKPMYCLELLNGFQVYPILQLAKNNFHCLLTLKNLPENVLALDLLLSQLCKNYVLSPSLASVSLLWEVICSLENNSVGTIAVSHPGPQEGTDMGWEVPREWQHGCCLYFTEVWMVASCSVCYCAGCTKLGEFNEWNHPERFFSMNSKKKTHLK